MSHMLYEDGIQVKTHLSVVSVKILLIDGSVITHRTTHIGEKPCTCCNETKMFYGNLYTTFSSLSK